MTKQNFHDVFATYFKISFCDGNTFERGRVNLGTRYISTSFPVSFEMLSCKQYLDLPNIFFGACCITNLCLFLYLARTKKWLDSFNQCKKQNKDNALDKKFILTFSNSTGGIFISSSPKALSKVARRPYVNNI